MTDLVFLVDESRSEIASSTHDWLASIVEELDSELSTVNGIDVQYGLVGFGEYDDNGTPEEFGDDSPRYSHSQFVDPDTNKTDNERLFGDATAIEDAFGDLSQNGGDEDGWDALEHAIAEYDVRPGSVPVFVLVQNDEGRVGLVDASNRTLTHDGVLSALRSKNAILNTLVVGEAILDIQGFPIDWMPLFDMVSYGFTSDVRVLGVDADVADGVVDGYHSYYAFDTDADVVPSTLSETESEALQISYNGSNTGATGMVGSGKSILIGENITGGIGGQASDANQYRAKSIPFEMVSMTGATEYDFLDEVSYSFDFFGDSYTELWINQNGTISFGNANFSPINADLSQAVSGQTRPTDPLIAVLWDYMFEPFSNPDGKVLWRTLDVDGDTNDDLVIQWQDYQYVGDSGTLDTITFQAILYASGKIQFNYEDIDSFPSNDFDTTVVQTGGISATVGIWSGQADEITLPAGKFVPGPHSIGGETNSQTYGETPDSYVRMAWDTGGAAWDTSIIGLFGVSSPEANALRDAFVASLGEQILRADEQGKVFHEEEVLLALNVGGSSDVDAGAAGVFRADDGTYTADGGAGTVDAFTASTGTVDVTSTNSIPAGTTSALEDVFASARGEQGFNSDAGENVNLTIDKLDLSGTPDLLDGKYIVELFFAELGSGFRAFDVVIEGETMLNDYDIATDHAKIDTTYSTIEHDSTEVQSFIGIVKQFQVDVRGGDGLQIDLVFQPGASSDPVLNGLRVLKSNALAPRVTNVVLKSTEWADGVDYSYAEAVFAGDQLRPMFRENADILEVHFDGPVDIQNGDFTLYDSGTTTVPPDNFFYNPDSHIAIWTFDDPLDASKYRLELSTGVTGGGNALDGEWLNFTGDKIDDFEDDDEMSGRIFLSGDGSPGAPGNVFEFLFSILPGDRNQDGIVTTADESVSGDVDGDGDSDGADTSLVSGTYANTSLPQRKNRGDYLDDDIVDQFDYNLWWMTFGSTTDLRADGNLSGQVDTPDFTIWRNSGGTSAWANTVAPGGGSFAPQVLVDEAPRVSNVIVSGSNSMHDPYSFDTVDGSGEQLRTVTVGGADTISIAFSEDVNVEGNFLRLTGMHTANQPELAEFAYDVGTMTATWRFDEMFTADHYLISLNDAVTDIEGDALDGEWVNPESFFTSNAAVSEFPSGDGNPGGAFNFAMTIFPGDIWNNNIINSNDQWMFDYYSSNPPANPLFTEGDFNGDGEVDSADQALLTQNYLTTLFDLQLLADLDGDWDVDEDDVAILYDNWWNGLPNPTPADGDLNDDGVINIADLDLAFAQYGLELSVVS